MGRKCSVQGCLSDSNREEDVGVTFHKVPMQPDVRCKWLGLCRISEEKKSIKVIHICSRHFLRADFCNFKGKKYMLRQGVFPSVFPWDKSKLEAIKSEKQQLKAQISNIQPLTENEKVSEDRIRLFSGTSTIGTSLDTGLKNEIKKEPSPIEFFIDNRINALDFNDKWCPARIKEVDEEENEVLIHFETNGNEYDEWICMDSPRLRSLDWKEDYQQLEEHSCIMANLAIKIPELNEEAEKDHLEGKNPLKYECGERCLAYWSKRKKFPATINKALENDNYEVLFDDGYVKSLKWSRIVKVNQQLQSSPLFDPIQSSKQERRDKKRKINVAELFGIGKRQKTESTPSSPKVKTTCSQECLPKKLEEDWESEQGVLEEIRDKTSEEDRKWLPRWVDGHPVGTDSQLEFQDGTKKTVIVPDPRLPEGWTKHLTKRCQGFNAGKWDTIIVSPTAKVAKAVRRISSEFPVKRRDPSFRDRLSVVLDNLKQKIRALGHRIRRYNERCKRYKNNRVFYQNQKQFFRDLQETEHERGCRVDPGVAHKFWSEVWSSGGVHDEQAYWIDEAQTQIPDVRMAEMQISEADIGEALKGSNNWSAPGPDKLHNYWWKHLTSSHGTLARLLQRSLEDPTTIPDFFTVGVTHLSPKDGNPQDPKNYRPITCLSTVYKILTAVLTRNISQHLRNNNLMAREQNGGRIRTKGCKELLVIDYILTKQARRKLRNISVTWVDYQKAFDSVPHSWLIKVLEMHGVNDKVIKLLAYLMKSWRTALLLRTGDRMVESDRIRIGRGIFQGDTLSPIWFCMALNPLSMILNNTAFGYVIDKQRRTRINQQWVISA